MSDAIGSWLEALEARHLADLRVPEVTRAIRALSTAYVERRRSMSAGSPVDSAGKRAPLGSAGKRAAFALYYAPLHFIVTDHVVRALGAESPAPPAILDLGCGTGAAGAAWAIASGGKAMVTGIDRHPWAVDEARWTYRQLGLAGRATRGDVTHLPRLSRRSAVVAAYVLNELDAASRQRVEEQLLQAAGQGVRVLILEPISREIAPWWAATVSRFTAAGGRADEWRFSPELPALVQLFDRAAGLNHREMTARSIYVA
jgi:ubiquinone/menaquinone biosynthesis C-methylase UbiE